MNDRPMPGPPECLPFGFPHEGAVINAPGCLLHARNYRANSKRLTDAECAAEFWRAKSMLFYFDPHWDPEASSAAETAERTWNRFATRSHVLEDTND